MRYHYWNAMGYSGMTIENGILQFEFNWIPPMRQWTDNQIQNEIYNQTKQ
jgi:hypothetical protein